MSDLSSPTPAGAGPVVELCESCRHFIGAGCSVCPFCAAPHTPAPPGSVPALRRRAAARSRIALASGAALLAVACGGAGAPAEGDSEGSGGGEVVEGELSDDGSGGDGAEGSCGEQAEPSCAGVCGSHHHPACMDDEVDPCEAPPYGAPPGELWV